MPKSSSRDGYDESPRVKVSDAGKKSKAGKDDSQSEYAEDRHEESAYVDEDEMIDVAEKIFVRIA